MELAVIIILGIALLASLGLNGFILIILTTKHQEEKKDLHNRLMSRDYPDYLSGEHTNQLIREAEEKAKNKPKEHEKYSREFLEHKAQAEKF